MADDDHTSSTVPLTAPLPTLHTRSGKLRPTTPRTSRRSLALQISAADMEVIYRMMAQLPEGTTSASGIARRCMRAGATRVMEELGLVAAAEAGAIELGDAQLVARVRAVAKLVSCGPTAASNIVRACVLRALDGIEADVRSTLPTSTTTDNAPYDSGEEHR